MPSTKNVINPYINSSLEFDRKLLKIPLKESGEKMVNLVKLIDKSGVKVIFNHKPIILDNDKKIFYLREKVANSFVDAAKEINSKGYIFQIQDAYRNPANQKDKFARRVKEIESISPGTKGKRLFDMANMYTAGIPILAAHTAGAAVDIVLLDMNLKKINMGSEYPVGEAASTTDYPFLSKKIKKLRNTLVWVMTTSGFTNYPFEWWHFSLGDVCAAYFKNEPYARYGPVYFEAKSEKIKFMPMDQCYSYFDI